MQQSHAQIYKRVNYVISQYSHLFPAYAPNILVHCGPNILKFKSVRPVLAAYVASYCITQKPNCKIGAALKSWMEKVKGHC